MAKYLDDSGLTYFWGKVKNKIPNVEIVNTTSDYDTYSCTYVHERVRNLGNSITDLDLAVSDKVDKVTGKGLSTEDYTTAEKTKLSGIEASADVNTIESISLNGTALTPDANKNVNIVVSGSSDEIAISTTQPTGDETLWINPTSTINGFDLDKIYPVGSIYINTTGTNPSTFLGGTWSSFGAGKVPVGQDTTQTEFDTLGETGGSKTTTIGTTNLPWSVPIRANLSTTGDGFTQMNYGITGWNWYSNNSVNTATSVPVNNLQPYIVVSMWVRTA